MLAEDHLRAGRLEQCLEALQDSVRHAPGDAKLRIFLFQLLAVLGQWERAVKQLQTVAGLDRSTEVMARTYRELIRCEVLRAEVFAGRRTPMLFGEPQAWMATLVEALKHDASGDAALAQALRSEALEQAPPSPGSVDGAPIAWIADADSRLGPMLEAIIQGRYYWVPFQHLRSIQLEAPTDLRDLVWLPAQLTFHHDGEVVAFIPTRYCGTETHPDGLTRLARRTEWQPLCEGAYRGMGQRVLVTDQSEQGLSEVRRIELDAVHSTRPAPTVATADHG